MVGTKTTSYATPGITIRRMEIEPLFLESTWKEQDENLLLRVHDKIPDGTHFLIHDLVHNTFPNRAVTLTLTLGISSPLVLQCTKTYTTQTE